MYVSKPTSNFFFSVDEYKNVSEKMAIIFTMKLINGMFKTRYTEDVRA